MGISRTYHFTPAGLAEFLADFADWLAQAQEDDPSDGDLLGQAHCYLKERPVPHQTATDPRIVGHCAYCEREMYETEPLFKERHRGYYIWVCYICARLHETAIVAGATEDVHDNVPVWRAAFDTLDAGQG